MVPKTIDELVYRLERGMTGRRLTFSGEIELHARLADAMAAEGLEFKQEVTLSPGERIDFMLGRLGLEVKVRQPVQSVLRQLQRYLEQPQLDGLLMVSIRHMPDFPTELAGKPVRQFALWSYML